MSKPVSAKTKLLDAARALFWTRGYSNVSVREVARAAGVDAALVSRYFGSKQGLFEATLPFLPTWNTLMGEYEYDDLLERAVRSFTQPHEPGAEGATAFTMLLANIIDPEMGDRIRDLVTQCLFAPLVEELDGELDGACARERGAMLLAVLFGVALMRKTFRLEGLADKTTEELRAQMRDLGQAALDYRAP